MEKIKADIEDLIKLDFEKQQLLEKKEKILPMGYWEVCGKYQKNG